MAEEAILTNEQLNQMGVFLTCSPYFEKKPNSPVLCFLLGGQQASPLIQMVSQAACVHLHHLHTVTDIIPHQFLTSQQLCLIKSESVCPDEKSNFM